MSTPTTESPIASASEAERLIESLNAITDQLEETIGQETARGSPPLISTISG